MKSSVLLLLLQLIVTGALDPCTSLPTSTHLGGNLYDVTVNFGDACALTLQSYTFNNLIIEGEVTVTQPDLDLAVVINVAGNFTMRGNTGKLTASEQGYAIASGPGAGVFESDGSNTHFGKFRIHFSIFPLPSTLIMFHSLIYQIIVLLYKHSYYNMYRWWFSCRNGWSLQSR